MTHVGIRRGLAVLAVGTLLSGCYKYVPTDAGVTPIGEDVRILVTRLGAAELAEVVPTGPVSGAVSGKMEGTEGDDLLLSVPVGERREGFMMVDLRQTVRVPMGEVLSVERRELDKAGTAFVIAGAAGLGVAVVLGIMEAFGTAPPPDGGPPPDDFSFVFGRLALPWGR